MHPSTPPQRVAIIGRGRLGVALSGGLSRAGHQVTGPLARDYRRADVAAAEMVLLCVPDHEIAPAAATLAEHFAGAPPLVGHCSGATGLTALDVPQAFSLHPLMTVVAPDPDLRFEGAVAAVAGSTPSAAEAARGLARDLGMRPVIIAEEHRAAYHAAASVASNFLVTLEAAAERLAATAGAGRDLLVPLVRQTVDNWAARGASALTGPIARGDVETVARQRAAVSERAPDLLALFDALAEATRALVAHPAGLARVAGPDAPGCGGGPAATEAPGSGGDPAATEAPGSGGDPAATEAPGSGGDPAATEAPGAAPGFGGEPAAIRLDGGPPTAEAVPV